MKTFFCSLLALYYLGFFGIVSATEENIFSTTADVKFDFVRVQEVGEKNKTAACIVAWVADDVEGKVFCRYELEKKTGFLRDNTEINKIFSRKTKLLITSSSKGNFPIDKWFLILKLGEELSSIQSTISELFNDFVNFGVEDFSTYLESEKGLFKSSSPYDLVLPKTLDDSYTAFAVLAHHEIHRAMSPTKSEQLQKLVEQYGEDFLDVLENPEIQKAVQNLILNQVPGNTVNALVEDKPAPEKIEEPIFSSIVTSVDNIQKTLLGSTVPNQLSVIEQLKTTQMIMLLILTICGVLLLLLIVIIWLSRKSQPANLGTCMK